MQLNPNLPGKLDGIIHDFACGLDEYLLNCEAKQFQYLRVLVDGSHWQRRGKSNQIIKGKEAITDAVTDSILMNTKNTSNLDLIAKVENRCIVN